MAEWHEFSLWYAINNLNPSDIFAFKKTHLLPMLERYGVEDFLMLDERDFVVLRVDINGESAKRILSDLEETIADDRAIDLEAWLDARTFLLGCPIRLVQMPTRGFSP